MHRRQGTCERNKTPPENLYGRVIIYFCVCPFQLGQRNTFYYNEELGQWVERGQEHLVQKKEAALLPPPMPKNGGKPNDIFYSHHSSEGL